MEGEHRRLHAKAEEGRHERHLQRLPVLRGPAQIQDAAVGEVQMPHAVVQQKDDADKGKRRAGQGVHQVLPPGVPGLLVHGVHHQGQRGQGQHLIEEVQGQKVLGVGNAQHHAVGHQPEGEEPVLMPLVGHIVQGVRRHQRPQHRDDGPIDHGGAVDPQGDGERLVEAHHDAGQIAAPVQVRQHDAGQGQGRRQQRRRHDIAAAHSAALGLENQQADAQHHGDQDGQREKLFQGRTSLLR